MQQKNAYFIPGIKYRAMRVDPVRASMNVRLAETEATEA